MKLYSTRLRLGEGKKKGIASYLFIRNVHKLIKIYFQARGCMTRIEKIPDKAGKTWELNKQFQDNVDRGAVRKLLTKKLKIQRTHELYYHGRSVHEQSVNDDTPQVCMKLPSCLGWASMIAC